ncbi:MAG: hypothetical protein JWN04_5079 [Myxococcaceae bacterium]|nr:hypothetical protein [Myxococcaceae bacterium]
MNRAALTKLSEEKWSAAGLLDRIARAGQQALEDFRQATHQVALLDAQAFDAVFDSRAYASAVSALDAARVDAKRLEVLSSRYSAAWGVIRHEITQMQTKTEDSDPAKRNSEVG